MKWAKKVSFIILAVLMLQTMALPASNVPTQRQPIFATRPDQDTLGSGIVLGTEGVVLTGSQDDHIFVYTKFPGEECISTYPIPGGLEWGQASLETAKTECNKDEACVGVSDFNEDHGGWLLCDDFELVETSTGAAYQKYVQTPDSQSYVYSKKTGSECTSTYDIPGTDGWGERTLELAKTECDKNPGCGGVSDYSEDHGGWTLCNSFDLKASANGKGAAYQKLSYTMGAGSLVVYEGGKQKFSDHYVQSTSPGRRTWRNEKDRLIKECQEKCSRMETKCFGVQMGFRTSRPGTCILLVEAEDTGFSESNLDYEFKPGFSLVGTTGKDGTTVHDWTHTGSNLNLSFKRVDCCD